MTISAAWCLKSFLEDSIRPFFMGKVPTGRLKATPFAKDSLGAYGVPKSRGISATNCFRMSAAADESGESCDDWIIYGLSPWLYGLSMDYDNIYGLTNYTSKYIYIIIPVNI